MAHALDDAAPPALAGGVVGVGRVGVSDCVLGQQARRLRRRGAAAKAGGVAVAGDVEEALFLGQRVGVGQVGRRARVRVGGVVQGEGGGGVVGVVVGGRR